jgi:hypothetical protein
VNETPQTTGDAIGSITNNTPNYGSMPFMIGHPSLDSVTDDSLCGNEGALMMSGTPQQSSIFGAT